MITQMQQDALHVCDALRNLIASTRVRALQQDEVPRPLSNPIDLVRKAPPHVRALWQDEVPCACMLRHSQAPT